jgi:hypothetical protein
MMIARDGLRDPHPSLPLAGGGLRALPRAGEVTQPRGRKPARALRPALAETEPGHNRIDALVYELYGLGDEMIKIVEGL